MHCLYIFYTLHTHTQEADKTLFRSTNALISNNIDSLRLHIEQGNIDLKTTLGTTVSILVFSRMEYTELFLYRQL